MTRAETRTAVAAASVTALALLAAMGACRSQPAPTSDPDPDPAPEQAPDDELGALAEHGPEQLAAYLRGVAGADLVTRQREVASWKLSPALFAGSVAPAYRGAYAEYAAAFDAAAPAVVAQLADGGEIATRRHFADDPAATNAQIRLRWALPVMFPSVVATVGGAPIDTAFVPDDGRWRALLGLPEVQLARVRAAEPACAALLLRASAPGPCTSVGYLVTDAALRGDRPGLARACQLAAARCR